MAMSMKLGIRFRPIASLLRSARRLTGDTRGSIAIIAAVTTVAFMVAGGTAVDFARASRQRQVLNSAVDAAALALATSKITDVAVLKALGEKYVNSNLAAISNYEGGPVTLDIDVYTDTVTISAHQQLPTTLMKLAHINEMDLTVFSEARRVTQNAEVVLVLDNTGSMTTNNKIGALKTATEDLTDILFADSTVSTHIKMAIVPFAASVNVGTQYANASWMDTNGNNAISKLNFTDTTKHNKWAWGQLSSTPWNGCVEQRKSTSTINYDVDDTAPSTGTPDTLFPFYFAPDEPTNGNNASSLTGWGTFNNNYLTDWRSNESVSNSTKNGTSLDNRQRRYQKYVSTSPSGSGKGPGYNCGTASITPLTNVKQTITDAIDDMVATGNTNIASGVGWGLRVLSSTVPFTEGAAYNDKKWRKIMVVMTDGENDWGNVSNMNKTGYGGYGYSSQSLARLNINSISNSRTALDTRTAKACAVAKAASTNPSQPIVVYSITFGSLDTQAKNLMKACASDIEKYFHAPDNATLLEAFTTIATEITQVYLSK